MKKVTFLSLFVIIVSAQLSHAQLKKAKADSTELSVWEDLDTEPHNWPYIKHLFVPKELGAEGDTLLLETMTLIQHKRYFKRVQKDYYEERKIDTARARYKTYIPNFIDKQQAETNKISKGLPFPTKEVNMSNIANEDIHSARFVLKKRLKIHHLNPRSARGDMYLEYFIYDRKLDKEYPHMSAILDRIIEYVGPLKKEVQLE